MAAQRQYELDFRREEVEYVIRQIEGSTSTSLVGIGSAGKSNLIQHLLDPRVHHHYFKDKTAASLIKPITIDANMLGALPTDADIPLQTWAGYELMMHRLFISFHPFEMLSPEEAKLFFATYQDLQNGANPLFAYMALRYFELGIQFFLRKGYKLVFLFDEFDELLRQLPVKFFQTLRGIRDLYKRQIVYLTFTRSPLPTLIERHQISALGIEPFSELFTDNVVYVGPYNEKDATKMLRELAERRKRTYPDVINHFLLRATGGYAGLLRAGYAALEEVTDYHELETLEAMARYLGARRALRLECKTIWAGLNAAEHTVLKAVGRLAPYNTNHETQEALNMLIQKRLLQYDKQQEKLIIEPPIFSVFVQTNPDSA